MQETGAAKVLIDRFTVQRSGAIEPGSVQGLSVVREPVAASTFPAVTDRPKGATEDRRNGATRGWLKRDSNGVSGCGVSGVLCNR